MVRLVTRGNAMFTRCGAECRGVHYRACVAEAVSRVAQDNVSQCRKKNETFALKMNERGAVYVEFLIAFLPVFIFVLGIAQLAFIASAKAVVEHAAWAAARSAVVVLDDDIERYGGVPRGNFRQYSSKTVPGIDDVMKTLNIDTGSSNAGALPTGGSLYQSATAKYDFDDGISKYLPPILRGNHEASSRMTPIRAAAYMPLLPLANTDSANYNGSVSDAIHDQFFYRMNAALKYTRAAAAVTLHSSESNEAVATQPFEANSTVTARVVYLFSCDVPIVRQLLCRSLDTILLSGDSTITKALGEAENATIRSTVLSARGRYTVLSGKSTLVNQSAGYENREEKP